MGKNSQHRSFIGSGLIACAWLLLGLPEAAAAVLDEIYGDGFDGFPSNVCDAGLPSQPSDPVDYARAMGLCATTTQQSHDWGVITASFTRADGNGLPATQSRAVRPSFGTNNVPLSGASLLVLSTGYAAAPGQTNPGFVAFQPGASNGVQSPLPADWLAAHGGAVPTSPACPALSSATAYDPVMLTLDVRVPNNARSFSLALNYFGADFPEYVCSSFNDVFVALLDSNYAGAPANPADKNLAGIPYPVGVNLAYGNTGFFTQCINGPIACGTASPSTIGTCTTTAGLVSTGMDTPDAGHCTVDGLLGGASGWLQIQGNVLPGETIRLRLALWDTGDGTYDSLVLLDDFRWSGSPVTPGTSLRLP